MATMKLKIFCLVSGKVKQRWRNGKMEEIWLSQVWLEGIGRHYNGDVSEVLIISSFIKMLEMLFHSYSFFTSHQTREGN